ncbi:MAG: hypothetical protein LBR70_04350 [Lactobacillaceae bacterium]|jgi:hypothetical protein|nr:hypothetical protein [Lactobacillaceae bacterium]
MSKKLIIGIILTIILAGAIVGKLLVFDDSYIAKVNIEDSFRYNIAKEMRLVPLDYMNKKEVSLCHELRQKLKDNAGNMKFTFSSPIKAYGDLYKTVKDRCGKDDFEAVMSSKDGYEYSTYNLDNGEVYILVKTPNMLNVITAFDKKDCKFDDNVSDKSLIVSENAFVAKIDGEYYLISEWFAPDKYVFYYLNSSPEYNGVICRFDVEKS